MDARRTGQLGQAADGILHLAGSHHHKVCQLVDDDHNLRQLFRLFPILNVIQLFYTFIVSL